MNRSFEAAVAVALLLAVASAPAGAAQGNAYDTMIEHYEAIRLALLDDTLNGVEGAAASLTATARALATEFDAAEAGVPAEVARDAEALIPLVASAAQAVAAAPDLAAARAAFGELSEPLLRYRELVGDTEVKVAYCPMAKRSWLQKDGETLGNPYYGQSMAGCGTFQKEN